MNVAIFEGRSVRVIPRGGSALARHVPAPDRDDRIARLKGAFRGLLPMLSLYERTGKAEFVDAHGMAWHVHDLLAWYRASQRLPKRQAEAIHYGLVLDLAEREVAAVMGVSPTNPVLMYATDGLRALLVRTEMGWPA